MKVRITTVSVLEFPEWFVEDVRAGLGERFSDRYISEDLEEILNDLEVREGYVESTITNVEEVKSS